MTSPCFCPPMFTSPLIFLCSEFLDYCRHPAGGRLVCERSDAGRRDCAHEGNRAFTHTQHGNKHGPLVRRGMALNVWSRAVVQLWQACKRGNTEVVRLLLEYGADCNIMSKHKNTAMYFAKLSNNLMVCDLIKDHISM